MPVRLMTYEGLFYQALLDSQPAAAWRKLPPVIPVVVYNGWEPWHVATDLGSLIGELDPSAEIYRPQLRYRLVDEATYPREDLAAPRFGLSEEEVSAALTLEELETMLAESIDRWNREIREEGRQEGHQEGRQEGHQEGRQEGEARVILRLLRLKFGPLDPEVEERVRSADADRLLGWSEHLLTADSLQDVFRD